MHDATIKIIASLYYRVGEI